MTAFDPNADDQQKPYGLASLFPPPPAHETHTTTEDGSSTPKASPEYQSAIADVAQNSTDQSDILTRKSNVDYDVAKSIADTAKQQVLEMDKAAAEKAAEDAKQVANIKKQADILKAANDELKATPSPALFHQGAAWQNISRAVGIAIAGFGDALSAKGASLGGHAAPPSTVNAMINRYLDEEREHIGKLKDDQVIAMTGVKDAQQAREIALAKLDAKGAEAMKRAQLVGDYMVKAAGPQQAVYQSRLDALGLKQEADKFRAQSLSGLNKTITARTTTENIDRTEKPTNAQLPTAYHDPLTGKDLPIDPTITDPREHNTAVKDLPKVADAIQTLDKTMADVKATGPASPSLLNYIPGRTADTRQATRATDMQLVRSQYATAMGESLSEANAKKYDTAVPDPPSSFSTAAKQKEWTDRMQAVRDKIHQYYVDQLGNAGVRVNGAARATVSAASPAAAPVPAPSAAPTPPAPGAILQHNRAGQERWKMPDGSYVMR